MAKILDEQKRRVSDTADKYRDPQRRLGFDADEERQLEANRRHWERRLGALDHELVTEPERIRAIYEVKAQRIEPVGLIYLWPIAG